MAKIDTSITKASADIMATTQLQMRDNIHNLSQCKRNQCPHMARKIKKLRVRYGMSANFFDKDDVFKFMRQNYQLAYNDQPENFKSEHWDTFNKNFDRLFDSRGIECCATPSRWASMTACSE